MAGRSVQRQALAHVESPDMDVGQPEMDIDAGPVNPRRQSPSSTEARWNLSQGLLGAKAARSNGGKDTCLVRVHLVRAPEVQLIRIRQRRQVQKS